MSSTGQGGPGDGQNQPKGFKKFIRRASLVLKPKSKRQSVSDPSAFAPKETGTPAGSGSNVPTSPPTTAPAPTKAGTTPTPSVPAQITQTINDKKPTSTPVTRHARLTAKGASALQEEKAKAMFAKYGLTLEPGEWTTPTTADDAPRVEKRIRMRIHRTCHRCQTTFGHDRLCSNCQHTRCKKCPRSPGSNKPKRTKGKGADAGGVLIGDETVKGDEALTMSNRATGKEMTRRPPTQRVRRTCHECQTLFVGKAVQCENCKHMRCPQCPRDPPKKEKYPHGYPGDRSPTGEVITNPAQPKTRWNCEKCATTFEDEGKPCSNCGHEKCDSCPRAPSPPPTTTKASKAKDEAALQSVEERMRNLEVSPQASAA